MVIVHALNTPWRHLLYFSMMTLSATPQMVQLHVLRVARQSSTITTEWEGATSSHLTRSPRSGLKTRVTRLYGICVSCCSSTFPPRTVNRSISSDVMGNSNLLAKCAVMYLCFSSSVGTAYTLECCGLCTDIYLQGQCCDFLIDIQRNWIASEC